MSRYYIITIGGTGARCLESLVHLSASGVFDKNVSVLHIDADKDNGNWGRAFTALNHYKKIKHLIGTNNTDFFRHNIGEGAIEERRDDIWFYPLPENEEGGYYTSLNNFSGNSELTEILFTSGIRADKWDIGFKGRSSLGSIATAQAFEWNKRPWDKLRSDITTSLSNSKEVRVFFIGSIFGGTGSSIFPTIGKLFDNQFGANSNFFLGGSILLPYFTYTVPNGEQDNYAKPADFLVKTRQHMDYYKSLPFKKIYMLGETERKGVSASIGAKDQENPPHHLEMLAILAANNFFELNRDNIINIPPTDKFSFLGRKTRGKVIWEDLPELPGKQVNETKLLTFTTMSCSFIGFWYKLLRDDKYFKRSEWYIKHIGKDPDIDKNMEVLKEYLEDYFLTWLLGLHVQCGERDKKEYKDWILEADIYKVIETCLFSTEILKDFLKDVSGAGLNKLKWRPSDGKGGYVPKEEDAYDFLWKSACDTELLERISGYGSLSRVFHILCETSKKFMDINYSS
ncbi:MAG: hypothetical protein HQK95_02300 [Nitrospirae bacterium]|nr:hypothetical protein [Nitrospirota bacterium]